MDENHFEAVLSKDRKYVIINGCNKLIAVARNKALLSSILDNTFSCVAHAIESENINEQSFDFLEHLLEKIKFDRSTGRYSAKISIKNTRFGKGKTTNIIG